MEMVSEAPSQMKKVFEDRKNRTKDEHKEPRRFAEFWTQFEKNRASPKDLIKTNLN